MLTDLRRWAEQTAPGLDHLAWLSVHDGATGRDLGPEEWAYGHATPEKCRALLEHLRTVVLDVLTTRQAAALGLVCDDDLPPIGPTLAATLAELLAMELVTSSPIEATDFGREVHRVREESTP